MCKALWRIAIVTAALVGVALVGHGGQQLRAQDAAPPGYVILPTGWNLLSTATAQALDVPSADPALFTLQPGDSDYEVVNWQSLTVGDGYWVHVNENTALRLPPSDQDSYSVTVPPRRWIMVGNPSTRSSARISGADASLLYSALTATWREDTLLPVGAGALVWSNEGGMVSISVDPNDATPIDFAGCCLIGPGNFGGKAVIDIYNDTADSLLFGLRALSPDGRFPVATPTNYAYGALPVCDTCSDYATPPAACRNDVPMREIRLDPGTYLIRLTTEAERVPDIILRVPLQGDVKYELCRYLLADRQ